MSPSTIQSNPVAFALPPLPRAGEGADALSPNQRRMMVVAILAAHVAAVYGLMQVGAVREAMREAAPMFVDLIAPPAPPVPPPPPPPPQQPIQKNVPLPKPVIAAAPSPAPATFVVPAPPPEPVVEPAPPVVVASPAPPAPPPPPKMIPASAVQYLEPPVLVYPRLSIRNKESGRVIVRVYIDTSGLPKSVQVATSSNFARLDEAGVSAVQKARFKPYTENGQPVAGWALIPLDFDLEK